MGPETGTEVEMDTEAGTETGMETGRAGGFGEAGGIPRRGFARPRAGVFVCAAGRHLVCVASPDGLLLRQPVRFAEDPGRQIGHGSADGGEVEDAAGVLSQLDSAGAGMLHGALDGVDGRVEVPAGYLEG